MPANHTGSSVSSKTSNGGIPQRSSNISKDLINHRPGSTQKKIITCSHPTVNRARSSTADKASHPFLLTVNLVHQHKSLAVMRAALKQDPSGRNSKGREKDRKRENGGSGALLCSVSNQLDMCDLCQCRCWKPHTPISTNGVVGSGRQEVGGSSQK